MSATTHTHGGAHGASHTTDVDPSVKMATFSQLRAAWPEKSRGDLAKQYGGTVGSFLASESTGDISAVRLCAAFNYSHHPMPLSSLWTGVDVEDKQGMKYITDSESLKRFLESKLGRPRRVHNKNEIVSRRGILVFTGVKSLHGGTHFDLWDGTGTADVMGDMWNEAETVLLFHLPHDE